MKKYIYPLAITATALFATACSDNEVDDIQNIPDSQKEMISFSLSDGTTNTRAGFTGADTRIVARFESEEDGGTGVKYTRTVLKAAKDETGGADDFSRVSYYTTDNTRYWDDAFGRKAKISVYAVAIPNSTSDTKLTDAKLAGGTSWDAEGTPNNSVQWDVTYGTQTSTTLAAEDLVYSNNIKNGGKNGRYVWSYTDPTGYPTDNGRTNGHSDGQLVFTKPAGAAESAAGHFDKGHLVFNHALSRLTIKLIEGDGFDKTSATKENDFKFTNSANIKLLDMPYTGTLNIKEGTWGSISKKDIEKLISSSSTANKADESFSAQILPSYKFYENGATNVMQFVIDNNTYYITQGQIYTSLNTTENTSANKVSVESDSNGNYIEMKQGKNYQLSITVKKTAIFDVTATIAPWIEVAGSMEVNNAHLTFSISAAGSTCDKDIDLYRLGDDNTGYDANNYDFSCVGKNWFGNYSTDAKYKTTLDKLTGGATSWTTPWYFESNKTYYHFRTVNKGTTIAGNTGDGADATHDYFVINGGATADTDPHWGAPMQTVSGKNYLTYDLTKGYEDFLRPAIGATESTIAIQEIHMMSNINVILKTPSDGGKVALKVGETNTVVKITRLSTTGKVEMGRGVVTPTGEYTGEHTMTVPSTFWKTSDTETNPYTFTVVPQALSRNESSDDDAAYVGIFIQTPDHNQYYVVKKLITVNADAVSNERNQTKDQPIKRWYPGHNYTYTITISKKGIESITATIADWVNVTGNVGNITLED